MQKPTAFPAAWHDFDVVTGTAGTTTSEVPLSLASAGALPNEMFFRLVLPAPAVSGLQPAVINTGGGQIYIVGQGFEPGDVVFINGVAMTTTFISSTLLLVTVPALAAGIYNVEIMRGDDVIASQPASQPASLTVMAGLALETLEPPNLPPGAQIGGGLQAQYRYDALGRRIERIIQQPAPPFQVVTRFQYAGGNVIEERDGGGVVLANDGRVPMAEGEIWWFTVMRRNGQDYWLHGDDAGNTLALTDATGTVVERYDYDDYGQVRFLDATGALLPGATQSAAGNPYLFRGLRYEPEPRFFLAGGGRFWDPPAARFIARTGGGNGGQIFFDGFSNYYLKDKPADIKGADLEKALAHKEKPADIKGQELE